MDPGHHSLVKTAVVIFGKALKANDIGVLQTNKQTKKGGGEEEEEVRKEEEGEEWIRRTFQKWN